MQPGPVSGRGLRRMMIRVNEETRPGHDSGAGQQAGERTTPIRR